MSSPRYSRGSFQEVARPDYRRHGSFDIMIPWDPNDRSRRRTADINIPSYYSPAHRERRRMSSHMPGYSGAQRYDDHVTPYGEASRQRPQFTLERDEPERIDVRSSKGWGMYIPDTTARPGRGLPEPLTYSRPGTPVLLGLLRSSSPCPSGEKKARFDNNAYQRTASPERFASGADTRYEIQWEGSDDHFGASGRESSPTRRRPLHRQILPSGSDLGERHRTHVPDAPIQERLPTPDFDSTPSRRGSRSSTPEFCACYSTGQCSHREKAQYREKRDKMDKQLANAKAHISSINARFGSK